ncbi:MAG: hypothetical protein JXB25_07670 [Deltaproteobacteria bacterium]|nr:hypothetical protein [Deltaproteobacteria bacterium]
MLVQDLSCFEEKADSQWLDFFSSLKEAATGCGCEELKSYSEPGSLKMEFVTALGNRISAYLHRDELGMAFARILGLIKNLERDEEAVYFLMKSGKLGLKVFLDNNQFGDDSWQALLSFDHSLPAGIPPRQWFTRTLTRFDRTLHDLKRDLEFCRGVATESC